MHKAPKTPQQQQPPPKKATTLGNSTQLPRATQFSNIVPKKGKWILFLVGYLLCTSLALSIGITASTMEWKRKGTVSSLATLFVVRRAEVMMEAFWEGTLYQV